MPAKVKVRVPGGCLDVSFDDAGHATLTGPAVIVGRGELSMPDAPATQA